MKKLALIGIISFLAMEACTTVRFENPQPQEGIQLNQFPEDFQGLFTTADNDTLEISLYAFHFKNGDENSISGDLNSKETVLKSFKNLYVLSIKDEEVWDVFPVKARKNKLIVYYETTDGDIREYINDLKKTSQVKEIPDTEGKFGYYLVNPSAEEFEKLWKNKLFSDKLIFSRIPNN